MRSIRWFSADPSKAWAERFFLLYSPVWMLVMGIVMMGGLYRRWGDAGFLALGFGLAAPLVLVPLLAPGAADRDRPLADRFWLKANLWIGVLVWIGSYFGSHYFFDVLGMRYAFPTDVELDAALVGSDRGQVPFFLYPLTQCYFVTYHTVMVVAVRAFASIVAPRRWPVVLAVPVVAYLVAWAETYFMAIEALGDVFVYLDRPRMLRFGSVFYACYFVVSLPMYYRIDEPSGDEPLAARERWTPGRCLLDGLAAGMLVLILLDAWALVLGPLVE